MKILLAIAILMTATNASASCPALLDHTVKDLVGDTENLCQYAGKVVLVVNTASYCGYTPQYTGLEALHQKYKARGLVVLGFPSNDFGAQEPGTEKEIADFCDRTYAVRFPMFAKTPVKDAGGSPLYDALAKATGERPKWNFHKYLIGRDGRAAASFASKVEPESPELVARIEELLGK
ncbi:MAG TPA: glutathione peroxidase [Usitatibacter sp.]|nr:glutathione peroxidase [Usitatibacter sp.]